MKHLYQLFLLLFVPGILFAQFPEIRMPQFNNAAGFEEVVTTCGAFFYDSGGKEENYKFWNDGVITFCPESPDQLITLDVQTFSLMGGHYLRVYDGEGPGDPEVGFITNDIDGEAYFEASFDNVSGCLTLTFFTTWSFDDDTTLVTPYEGWESFISCKPRTLQMGQPSDLVLNDDPSGDLTEDFNLRQNDAQILGTLSEFNYEITYHLSEAEALSGDNPLPDIYPNQSSPQVVYARLLHTPSGTLDTEPFQLLVNPIPELPLLSVWGQCDEDLSGSELFELTAFAQELVADRDDRAILFYASPEDRAADGENLAQVLLTQESPQQTLYYRFVNTVTGTYAFGELGLRLDYIPELEPFPDLVLCTDPSGLALLDTKSLTEGVPNEFNFRFYRSAQDLQNEENALGENPVLDENTTVFVQITSSSSSCIYTDDFAVELLPPLETSLQGSYILCRYEDGSSSGPVELKTGLQTTDYTFTWFKDGQLLDGEESENLTVEEAGEYSVLLGSLEYGCDLLLESRIEEVQAVSQFALAVDATPFASNNTVRASIDSDRSFEYILNGQESNSSGVFRAVPPGENTVVAIDPFGCTTVEKRFFIIGCPKYFSPNEDSVEDTWVIRGGDPVEITKVTIFDRYGKLLAQLNGSEYQQGWDGTFNGRPVLESSLWFRVEYTYLGENLVSTGSFALIR